MRILLTGKDGQIGGELSPLLAAIGTVTALGREDLNLERPEEIRRQIARVRPQWIVNAAAYTAVDRAEKEPEKAFAINGSAPGVLAGEAARLGAAIIHFSTDYVFSGDKTGGPYTETDPPAPLGVYGASKLAGERAVARSGASHLIFRTSWIYGLRGKNFLLTMQRLARERDEIRVVDDQLGQPTWSRTVARAVARLLAGFTANGQSFPSLEEASGLYHLTCSGETTWYGFCRAILDASPLPQPRLLPIPTAEYPALAARPKYSVLSSAKFERTFRFAPPAWRDALQECLSCQQEEGPGGGD
ncbi:MAG: dTDP-4-dehydrorhamnose reductase [Nitrospinaceae bacterium]|jgi:dTDP-4-dehydrorhamnose reductase|nr:MAG: dTDP-4-dehydrorhamnose reductase [Nitrospinaceae bacterium]